MYDALFESEYIDEGCDGRFAKILVVSVVEWVLFCGGVIKQQ